MATIHPPVSPWGRFGLYSFLIERPSRQSSTRDRLVAIGRPVSRARSPTSWTARCDGSVGMIGISDFGSMQVLANLAENVEIPVYLQIDQGRGWTVDGHIELFHALSGPKKLDIGSYPRCSRAPGVERAGWGGPRCS